MSKSEQFNLEGRFLEFVLESGYKIKYLRINTATEELCIKIGKECWGNMPRPLTPGDWLQIAGEKKVDREKERIKYKAYQIIRSVPSSPQTIEIKPENCARKLSVLICEKSDCWKRGSGAVSDALVKNLRDRGLDEQVTIKKVGCLKQCKTGPNLVVMPSKARYSQIKPSEVNDIIDKHLVTTRLS